MTDIKTFKWAEVCLGGNNIRGDLQPSMDAWMRGFKSGWGMPAFISAYFLPDEAKSFCDTRFEMEKRTYEQRIQKARELGEDTKAIKKPKPSIRGYRGPHWAPSFMLDIDTRRESPDLVRRVNGANVSWGPRTAEEKRAFLDANPGWKPDTEAARREAFEVIRVLEGHGVDPNRILICFSGNKGFHIYVPTAYFSPEACGNFAYRVRWIVQEHLTKELKTSEVPYPGEALDWQVFTPITVLRAINSKHERSGLFKIPLTFDELQTLDFQAIRDLAKEQRLGFKHPDWRGITQSESLSDLWRKSEAGASQKASSNYENRGFSSEGRIHFDAGKVLAMRDVPRRPLCMLKLLREDVGAGNRNQAILIIASTLRNEGHTPAEVFALLKSWLALQAGTKHDEEYIHSQVEYVFRETFQWNCNHPLAMANCFSACHRYRGAEEVRGVSLHRLPDVLPELVARERIPISYYFPYPPFNNSIRLRPGMVVTLVAETGTGKTAFALDFCRYNSWNIERMINEGTAVSGGLGFASLEMPRPELVERAAQWAYGADQEQVGNVIAEQIASEDEKRPEASAFRKMREAIEAHYSRVWVSDEDGVDIERLKTIIVAGKEKHGIGLWAVDYLGRIHGKGKSFYEKLSSIALEMKTLARQTGVIILVLVQVGRDASEKGLGLRSARGSGEIEESSDILVTAEMEDRDKPEDQRSNIVIMTARKFRGGRKGGVSRLKFQAEWMRFYPADDVPEINPDKYSF